MVNLTGRGYFQKGQTTNVGRKWNEETNRKRSETLKGHPCFNHELKGCFKKGLVPWNKGKPFYKIRGDRHFNWGKHLSEETRRKISLKKNEGKSTQLQLLVKSNKYVQWRKAVFERDAYLCQSCRIHSNNLNAHHIKPRSIYPELIFNVENGITLCRDCHKKTNSWGVNANGKICN